MINLNKKFVIVNQHNEFGDNIGDNIITTKMKDGYIHYHNINQKTEKKTTIEVWGIYEKHYLLPFEKYRRNKIKNLIVK